MIRKIKASTMGGGTQSWLKTKFHFSFADYYNVDNMNFGVLRVFNDDLISAGYGFEMHPHKDMEIVTYVVDGKLTHEDSFNNKSTIGRGHVQFMSAGTGIYHSEHNLGSETLRTLQIWIITDRKGHEPNYGEYKYEWKEREDKWLHIVSSKAGNSNIKINQDVNMYVAAIEENKTLEFEVGANRQAYLVQIEGSSKIDDIQLDEQDAMEIVEESIIINSKTASHFIVIEMSKE